MIDMSMKISQLGHIIEDSVQQNNCKAAATAAAGGGGGVYTKI